MICAGELTIDFAFKNPEKKIIYACLFDKKGNIEKASFYSVTEFEKICPVKENYTVFYDITYEH